MVRGKRPSIRELQEEVYQSKVVCNARSQRATGTMSGQPTFAATSDGNDQPSSSYSIHNHSQFGYAEPKEEIQEEEEQKPDINILVEEEYSVDDVIEEKYEEPQCEPIADVLLKLATSRIEMNNQASNNAQHTSNGSQASLQRMHNGYDEDEELPRDQLRELVRTGQGPLTIGSLIRNSLQSRTITEVEIQTVARNANPNDFRFGSFVAEVEDAPIEDPETLKSLLVGTQFMNICNQRTVIQKVDKSGHELGAVIRSLVQKKREFKSKATPLLWKHVLPNWGPLTQLDLNRFYDSYIPPASDSSFATSLLKSILFESAVEKSQCWRLSYRPSRSARNDDTFIVIPKEVADVLLDFFLDSQNVFLPSDLIDGPIDITHYFRKTVFPINCRNDEFLVEVNRRRELRPAIQRLFRESLHNVTQYIRETHRDEDGRMIHCKSSCRSPETHLKWSDVKIDRNHPWWKEIN